MTTPPFVFSPLWRKILWLGAVVNSTIGLPVRFREVLVQRVGMCSQGGVLLGDALVMLRQLHLLVSTRQPELSQSVNTENLLRITSSQAQFRAKLRTVVCAKQIFTHVK